MISISTLLDPRYVFLIYAPLLFALNKRVGHRMILALTLAEWANQILKWLLAGERPYWYVHERARELSAGAPAAGSGLSLGLNATDEQGNNFVLPVGASSLATLQLKQFPVTCELGAGSPSGHAMVTATVWYILIDAYLKNELPLLERVNYFQINARAEEQSRGEKSGEGSSSLARLSWSMYTLMLISVSLSRVYLACHFPHQCVCGALLGALTARLVTEHVPMERLHKQHFAALTLFMFATAMATYGLLRLSGFDPLWSVDKAMRWCAKKEYIHMDTTPFFSMMRYLGFCLGVGLAYDPSKIQLAQASAQDTRAKASGPVLLARRLAGASLAVVFGQVLLAAPMPRAYLNLFYASQFVLYTLFAYAMAGPLPKLNKRLVPVS